MKKFKATKNISFENSKNKKNLWKNKQMLWIMAGFIVLLMVGSILTIMFQGKDDVSQEKEENGYKFVFTQQKGWTTKINNQDIGFAYLPSELNDIKKDPYFYLPPAKTYVAFNGNEFMENSQEINILLGFLGMTGRKAFPACTEEKNCGSDLPIANCDNAMNNTNIVYIYFGNETKIEQDKNCLKLESKLGDEMKIINLFVYQLLGIVR